MTEMQRTYVHRARRIISFKHLISRSALDVILPDFLDDAFNREAKERGMNLDFVMVGEKFLPEHDMMEFEIVGYEL